MKKLRVLSILFSIMFIGTSFIACAGGADDELDEEVPATTVNEEAADTSSTRQQQIDNAAAGSTVTLNTDFTDTSITITKALTVNGNGISGLTVTVNSNVTSNVTLKNFVNANIIVKPVSTTNNNIRNISGIRSARSAIVTQPYYSINSSAGSSNEGFEKMGDNALPLKLEDCDIAKFDAEADVALYMESGDGKKSVIDEINLKSGVEEFTFIEMDKADKPETDANEATATDKKSNVGELNIEGNGIEKINLIGGTFDDVNIADGFSGDPIDFKYDKEFSDQFGEFEGKTAFFNNSKIEEKDVGVVESTAGGLYKFDIPYSIYSNFDGRFTIVFMTDAQAEAMEGMEFSIDSTVANLEHPVYAVIPTGAFKIDTSDNTKDTFTIYGCEGGYIDYAAAFARGLPYYERQDVVVLENYRNYNKEAFIAKLENSSVRIYVNMANVKKEDVVICANTSEGDYGEAGTKMTEINLAGYKPYISLNWDTFETQYRAANPYPESSLTPEDIAQIVNDENNNLNREQTPQEVLNKIDADTLAYNNWETSFANAKGFALDNAISNSVQPINVSIPYGNSLKLSWEFMGTFTLMDTATSYPNVSNVTPTVKPVQGTNVYQQMLDNWQD